jgi:hypothetical protein
MTLLLEQLFCDLLQRYRFLGAELATASISDPIIVAYRDRILRQIERSITNIESLLDDPDLAQPDFARNIFHAFKRLSEIAQVADEGPVSALSRFQPRDLFLTRLVAGMCTEFDFPHARPLCSAITNQYYCILPLMDLLLVPHSEPDHLLGLPDIYHELGHLLFKNSGTLIAQMRECAQLHFRDEIVRAQRESWPATSTEALRAYSNRWFESWVTEFGCDLLATYVCGPAFGWTNTRLCARLSSSFFEIHSGHPADAARTAAIRLMLQRQGHISEAHQIDLQWEELKTTAGQIEPQEFRLAFPDSLLKGIVDEVVSYCQSVGIKRYEPAAMPIAKLLNDAWQQFLDNPAAFRAWETLQIERLRSQLGVSA